MSTAINAGKLDKPVQVLALRETAAGVWEWAPVRRAWAGITMQARTNLFSQVGIGARDAAIVLRRQTLTLHNAIRWGTRHLFLTAITERGRGHLDVEAALVRVAACRAVRTEDSVGTAGRPVPAETMRTVFPGVLTEKYARYEREETHAEGDTSYVLVTPKAIQLDPGDLVTVQDGNAPGVYHVTIAHKLDDYKNEYEIARRGDV